ncbi:MAG: M28 family peptidase [Flavobacteriales bacterium]
MRSKGRSRRQRDHLLLLLPLLLTAACNPDNTESITVPEVKTIAPALPPTPLFDPDSAYVFVKKQVDFGPRVPGATSHKACGDWMVAKLKGYGATVVEQTGNVTAFNGQQLPLRNIIASWNPGAKDRILLLTHWDSRPFADHDTERKNEPILGANDGGSGVGILLEIARQLMPRSVNNQQAIDPAMLGIDMLFTDVEDYGQPSGAMAGDENSMDTWALGSQYFAKNPHVPGYTARFGILLDMCGARDARFYREGISMRFAPAIANKVWKTAASIGFGDRFVQETKFFVGTDDHLAINEQLRIPTVDIIEYYEPTGGFNPSWHTHKDNMDVIDPVTLKAVGQTVLEVVWKER